MASANIILARIDRITESVMVLADEARRLLADFERDKANLEKKYAKEH